jgi:UDP-GlcNAc:undecaprenyl-phosphate GlcNAc-1-phosphate transferase
MDHPGEKRKTHHRATPLIGGIAIFIGVVACSLLYLPSDQSLLYGLLGAALLVVVGVLDDRLAISHHLRFPVQIAAALVLVLGTGAQLQTLGNLLGFGEILLGPLAIPFTVFAIVGLINAFNMIDGIDGLAAGLALIALTAPLVVTPQGAGTMQPLLLSVIAATLPFLARNLQVFPRGRKVFLGDAGSMLLGYIVAWALIDASQHQHAIDPVTALWIAALPLVDTFSAIGRRLLRRQSPFAADHGHLHHTLSRVTGSPRAALAVMLLVAALLAGLGVMGQVLAVGEPVMFYAGLVVFGLCVMLQHQAQRLHIRLRRRRRRIAVKAA